MKKYSIKESCCRFGEHRHLSGVITEPGHFSPRVALILVNAGLTPKFGPFRLYAQLARRLAAEGTLVLRFDLGGIGDSGQGYADYPLKERVALEIRGALDHLRERGRFDAMILGGLCSGAEDSFRYAETDPRVSGLVLMDPFGYKTPGWTRRDAVVRTARRALWSLGLLPTFSAGGDGAALIDYAHMERAESGRILEHLVARKVRMYFLYTGGMHESFNHKGQFKRMFGGMDFQGMVALDYFPRLRHTQALEEERRTVIGAIARRVRSAFPQGAD